LRRPSKLNNFVFEQSRSLTFLRSLARWLHLGRLQSVISNKDQSSPLTFGGNQELKEDTAFDNVIIKTPPLKSRFAPVKISPEKSSKHRTKESKLMSSRKRPATTLSSVSGFTSSVSETPD